MPSCLTRALASALATAAADPPPLMIGSNSSRRFNCALRVSIAVFVLLASLLAIFLAIARLLSDSAILSASLLLLLHAMDNAVITPTTADKANTTGLRFIRDRDAARPLIPVLASMVTAGNRARAA